MNYYETCFRNYDAQVGRFTGVDVLAENYFSQSPYHFSYNDPISFNDPLGAYPYAPNDQHTGLIFINGEYHFERSYWNYDPYSALGFGNPESPGGGGGPRSFADSKYGYDKYGNYGIWLRYSRPGTYSSETGLPEVVVGSMWVGLGSYYEKNYSLEEWSNGISTVGIGLGAIDNFGWGSLGTNFRFYANGWRGNQYVKTFRIAESAKTLGWVTFGFGTLMDLKGMAIYKNNPDDPDAVSPTHAGINFGFGIYGMLGGPIGWTLSGVYFGVQGTIGWDQAMQGVEMMGKTKLDYIEKYHILNYSDYVY